MSARFSDIVARWTIRVAMISARDPTTRVSGPETLPILRRPPRSSKKNRDSAIVGQNRATLPPSLSRSRRVAELIRRLKEKLRQTRNTSATFVTGSSSFANAALRDRE